MRVRLPGLSACGSRPRGRLAIIMFLRDSDLLKMASGSKFNSSSVMGLSKSNSLVKSACVCVCVFVMCIHCLGVLV